MALYRLTRGVAVALLLFGALGVLHAQEFSSSNFTVENPILAPGGYSTSTNFSLIGAVSQIAIGTSTSATKNLFGGFLYFPFVTTPAVSATPGDTQVSLTWTSAQSGVGWNIGGYAVGQSPTTGGPYTFANVGNVLSSTVSPLTNGTTYYFVIRVLDGIGNVIATSTEVSAMPVASSNPGGGGSSGGGFGGGGGGGSSGYGSTGVVFTGRAYPLSKVKILKDGQLAVSTVAGPDSMFKAILSGISPGGFTFSVYGEDSKGVQSSPFTFPVTLTQGVTTEIGGIFIAPTISVDKSEVKQGDTITVFGQGPQNADVMITVNSAQQFILKQRSDGAGVYLLNFDTSPLDLGNHSTKSKSIVGGEISSFSNTIGFLVGDKNVAATTKSVVRKGDLNGDGMVNLIDFSIAAYWYKRSLSNSFGQIEKSALNGDNRVDLIDFSIMAYNWTG